MYLSTSNIIAEAGLCTGVATKTGEAYLKGRDKSGVNMAELQGPSPAQAAAAEEAGQVVTEGEGQTQERVSQSNEEGAAQTANDSTQGVGESQTDEGEAVEDQFVKGEDGKEYISKEAFMARINKLSAQKNEAKTLLEAIKTDPKVREEFLEAVKGEERSTPQDDSQELPAFEQFLAPLPPEHQAHYRNFAKAMASEFESYVKNELRQAMKPVMSYIGESKVKSFASQTKDFGTYQKQVMELVNSNPKLSLEQAYKIASYEDKIKGAKVVGSKEEQERRMKLASNPAVRSSGGSNARVKPKSLMEALQMAGKETGYISE